MTTKATVGHVPARERLAPWALVVVGTSLGGAGALATLLGGLPGDFPLPVAVAYHRSDDRAADAGEVLRRSSALPVEEPDDKAKIAPGRVYLAPAGYHLLVERGSFALSTDEPVLAARPSIDVLFESAADAYGQGVVGVALTGASADGARGLARIKARGGLAVVQDPAEAESPVLPEAALAATTPDRVLPLAEIAPFLTRVAREGRGTHRGVPLP